MCGIVGYAGRKCAADIIYKGLERLEYRGYDSAGLATLCRGRTYVAKRQGRVCNLKPYLKDMRGSTGIGHTRWATCGEPSDVNAHPHTAGKFTVVHNGIIENFGLLKAEYFPDTRFTSGTDSEIIARLLDKFYDGNLVKTLAYVGNMLIGSYALMVICADFEGFAAVKYKSPVIIGYGESENYAASDAPALAGLCREISILEDGDIALISSDNISISNGHITGVTRKKTVNRASATDLGLGGYPHYMLKEINENPDTVANTALAFVSVEGRLREILAGIGRIIIVGCGTAYHSGLAGKRYIEELARMPAEAEIAGEFRYKHPIVDRNTAVIAVSQSGETADTVEAAKLARLLGAKVIAVTNSPFSALTRCSDVVVPVAAGCEICVAATKSYSGQLAALYLTACVLAGLDIREEVRSLADMRGLIAETIANADIGSLADMCARASGVYFLGRDMDYAVALEGSLKLKEVSYIPGEGYPAGELKHGTLALIDGDTVSIVIITDGELADKSMNAVTQVLSRRGKVAVITNAEVRAEGVGIIKIPPCNRLLSPLLSAACVQMLAYRTAVILGRDPDKPRNLAKSVTVE